MQNELLKSMKTSQIRTKKKQASEADASEAEQLIKEFLEQKYVRDTKTQTILEEYIKQKEKLFDGE